MGINRPSNYQQDDYIYRVYIVTNNDAYLLTATQDDINAFKTLGIKRNQAVEFRNSHFFHAPLPTLKYLPFGKTKATLFLRESLFYFV